MVRARTQSKRSMSYTTAETSINATLSGSYNGTHLNVSHASSPVYSGSAETDIIYISSPGGFVTGDDGYTWCDNVAAANSFKCDQQYVNFRYTSTTRPLACHETGHAVGLLHGANSNPTSNNQASALQCMKKTVSSADWHLGSNNTTSINNMY